MNSKDFIQNIISEIRADLTEEFDRNFKRTVFFTKKLTGNELPNQRGYLLMRLVKLRRSIKPT